MDKKDIENLASQYKNASQEKEEFLRGKQVPENALTGAKGASDGEAITDESVTPSGEAVSGGS